MERLEVTLDGLRELRHRAEQQLLEFDDWPVIIALISSEIAGIEEKNERKIAKIVAAAAAQDASRLGLDGGASGHAGESPGNSSSSGTSAPSSSSSSDASAPSIDDPEPRSGASGKTEQEDSNKPRAKGHGRNGANSYRTAAHVAHELADGVIGSLCDACKFAKMSSYREKTIVRVIGQAMFGAEVHHYEQARCRDCGHLIRAEGPEHVHQGIGSEYVRYDWSACAMLLFLHYFGGMPFKRMESFHEGWGVPMPDANQWEIVTSADDYLLPLYRALEQHAIQKSTNFRIDDTGAMVLSLKREIAAEIAALEAEGKSAKNVRTGINATGVYRETPSGPVLLFYTGRHHAGEIVDQVLRRRESLSPKLVKATDGASKNFDHEHADKLFESTCNAHAFLKFHEIKDKHPVEYAEAGRIYTRVFDNDDKAKALDLSSLSRMLYHREHSMPLMQQLKKMCEEKIASKLVEPSSRLWEPLTFVINQWSRLTLFCEVPGVPLDTNLVEQLLIIPVRYYAGSFNYRTEDGAVVGDRAMSLIATARANGIEPVAYLTECLRCHEDLAKNPEHYLPWVYRERERRDDDTVSRGPPGKASGREPAARPPPGFESTGYATLRQSSGKAHVAGSPPQIRTCNSRASSDEQGLIPSPAGHAEKHPCDKRLVQSQNPDPS